MLVKKTIRFLAVAAMLFSVLNFSNAENDQYSHFPMLPVQNTGGFTKISRMTEDYLELDGFGGKQVFLLSDGTKAENIILPEQPSSMSETQLSTQTAGPCGSFPFAQDVHGNRYVPSQAKMGGNCKIAEIYPDGFYIIKDSSNDPFTIFWVFRFGQPNELWSQRFFSNNINFQGRVSGFLLFESGSLMAIYEIESGRNVLITDYNFKDPRPTVLGNYMIFGKNVYDTRDWSIVLKSFSQVKGARVHGDILSYLSEYQDIATDDKSYFYYFERNLSSGEVLRQTRTDIPFASTNGYSLTEVFGAINGFVYFTNPVNGAFDIYDTNAGKSIFSHPRLFYSGNYHDQMDNGRYIAYLDSAGIYCFDTRTGKMWTSPNQVLVSDGGCDGQWIVADDFVDGKYVATFTHQEHPEWKVSITNPTRCILTEYSCVIEVRPNEDRSKLVVTMHEFDGSTGTFETPIESAILYGHYLINGKWYFATLIDGKMNLMTTEKNGFKTVFTCESPNRSLYAVTSGTELLFYLSPVKIGILDVRTGTIEYFEVPERSFSPIFAGNRHIVFSIPGNKKAILDRRSVEISFTENLDYLGFEGEKLYFSNESVFAVFDGGKLSITKNYNNVKGEFVKNGLIAGNNLFDTQGNFIQKLYSRFNSRKFRDFQVNQKSVSFDLGLDSTVFPNRSTWEACPVFSLERGESGLKITNLSDDSITGKIWLGNLSSSEAVVKLEAMQLEVQAKSSVEIGKKMFDKRCLVLIQSNAMLATAQSKLENLKPGYVMPMFEGVPETGKCRQATVVTVWGEDSD